MKASISSALKMNRRHLKVPQIHYHFIAYRSYFGVRMHVYVLIFLIFYISAKPQLCLSELLHPLCIHSASPNIFQLSRAQSFFSFPLSNMQLSFSISSTHFPAFSLGCSSNHHSLLLSGLHHSIHLTHTLLRATRGGILFSQACTSEGRRGTELEGMVEVVVVEGCQDRSIFKALSFHLFSFYLGGKKERRNKKAKACSHSHTKKRSRWPLLIKGNFHEQLTSLSTMLRCLTRQPPPQQTTAAKGRFVY